MIWLQLLWGFFRVGCFTFGGGYAAIPLIRDVVLSCGWLSEEELTYLIAICESTPGPIMVNLATYVGNSQAGLPGAALATLAVVTPSFCIILLICALLKNALQNFYVQAALSGLKPCITGIILATGVCMLISNCVSPFSFSPNWEVILITLLLLGARFLWKRLFRQRMSPITLILLSAVLGILVYGF